MTNKFISVDGGINERTAAQARDAGAMCWSLVRIYLKTWIDKKRLQVLKSSLS